MTIQRKRHPYYKFDKLLSYNAIFNMVCGGRGIGKTYGAEKLAIKRAIDKGEEFIYLRRYRSEISSSKNTFFGAVGAEFPDWDLRVSGNNMECAHVSTRDDKKREWRIIGYFVALSTAQSKKGAVYHNVRRVIFDEFLVEPGGRYLPDELEAFINFIITVDRFQDKTTVLMLSNAVSIMNPYMIGWEIDPQTADKNGIVKKDDLIAHFPDSEDFKKSIYDTRFGKFIQGTEYAKYAVENQFDDNHDGLVSAKDPQAMYMYTLETSNGMFSVWANPNTNEWYAQQKRPRASEVIFTTDITRMSEGKEYVSYTSKRLAVLRGAFNGGRLTFDHAQTRNSMTDIFKR